MPCLPPQSTLEDMSQRTTPVNSQRSSLSVGVQGFSEEVVFKLRDLRISRQRGKQTAFQADGTARPGPWIGKKNDPFEDQKGSLRDKVQSLKGR